MFPALACDYRLACVFPPAYPAWHDFALRGVAMFPVQVFIYAGFINVDNVGGIDVFDRFLIPGYLVGVLFCVPEVFFLKVYPRAFSMRLMQDWEHPQCSAISRWYASG